MSVVADWPKRSFSVHVTHYSSPDEIFVRDERLQEAWRSEERHIAEEITRCMKEQAMKAVSVSGLVNKSVAVRVNRVMYRGLVVATIDEKTAQVRLVDTGRTAKVSAGDIRPLPVDLRKKNAFCFCVKISNADATGTGNPQVWSMRATERLGEILEGKKLRICREGEPVTDEKNLVKLPCSMYYKKDVDTGPFSETIQVLVDVVDDLVEEGLALRMTTAEHSPMANVDDLSSVCGSLSVNGNDEDDYDVNSLFVDDNAWPLPQLPNNLEFEARVTYIDDQGQIYVQTASNEEAVMAMSKILSRIHNRLPASTDDFNLMVGDPVVALYPNFKRSWWYRGIIVDVKPNRVVRVLFVDFGDTKDFYRDENFVHKSPLVFDDVPVQVLRCKLDNIVPAGATYTTEFLNSCHEFLVDKKVSVRVTRKRLERFPLPVIMHVKGMEIDNGNVARTFVRQEVARKVEGIGEWHDAEATKAQNAIAFNIHPRRRPDVDSTRVNEDALFTDETVATLTNIAETYPKFLQAQPTQTDDKPLPVEPQVVNGHGGLYVRFATTGESQAGYEHLSDRLQTVGVDGQSIPEREIILGLPCACRFEQDGMWYRAVVVGQPDLDTLTVLFVDYGNVESVDLECAKRLPWSLMALPQRAVLCSPKLTAAQFAEQLQDKELGVTFKDGCYKLFYQSSTDRWLPVDSVPDA